MATIAHGNRHGANDPTDTSDTVGPPFNLLPGANTLRHADWRRSGTYLGGTCV